MYHRHSTRLQGYDYTQAGVYFVTICAFDRLCMFGRVHDGAMHLSDVGTLVEREWLRTEQLRATVDLDVYVVMPNHFHGILLLTNSSAEPVCSRNGDASSGMPRNAAPGSLGAIISQYKSAVTKAVLQSRTNDAGPVWQRNYHEHIIRNERELRILREYVENNPLRWEMDSLYAQ